MPLHTPCFEGENARKCFDLDVHDGADSPEVVAFRAQCQAPDAPRASADAAPQRQVVPVGAIQPRHEPSGDAPVLEDPRCAASVATPVEPAPLLYGAEQWSRCVAALAVELEHLFDGEGRDRLAVRCLNKLHPGMRVLVGVYDRAHAAHLVHDLANLNTAAYMVWATLNPFDTTVRTTNRFAPGPALSKQAMTRVYWLL